MTNSSLTGFVMLEPLLLPEEAISRRVKRSLAPCPEMLLILASNPRNNLAEKVVAKATNGFSGFSSFQLSSLDFQICFDNFT